MKNSTLTSSQTKTFVKHIDVSVRYDDQRGNGHNTFSVTGWSRGLDGLSGCTQEEIAKYFPELRHLIKWHLVSSDGPMHYIDNTMYHADDKDCWGLRKGEKQQIRKGGKIPRWRGVVFDEKGNEIDLGLSHSVASHEKPADNGDITYVPWYRTGEGKTPDLDAARSCALWPDATLEDLQSKEKLLARLPKLLEEFRADMESLGFIW